MAGTTLRQSDDANLHERRMTTRVAREWVGIKRQNPYPSINHLNPTTFSANWDWCILARSVSDDVTPTKDSLEFEFVGRNFHHDAPLCVAGTHLASIPHRSRLYLATDLLPKMFEQQTAIIFQGILAWSNVGTIRFRTIALPFGDIVGKLKYAVGAFSHILTQDSPAHQLDATELFAFREGAWLRIEPGSADDKTPLNRSSPP